MANQVASKTLGVAFALAAVGWAVFLAGMIRVVSHPLQPPSLAFLFGETALSLVSLRLSEKTYREQGGIAPRFSYVLAAALFGTALFPFWIGLAFSHAG